MYFPNYLLDACSFGFGFLAALGFELSASHLVDKHSYHLRHFTSNFGVQFFELFVYSEY
jgi:hypothetical protein